MKGQAPTRSAIRRRTFGSTGGKRRGRQRILSPRGEQLREKNVSDEQIYIFDDFAQKDLHYSSVEINHRTFDLLDFQKILSEIKSDSAIIIVTGHGSAKGIPILSTGRISPKSIADSLRSISNLKIGIVVLGQCYAGIYNYIDASTNPNLIVIGATNLHNSLSAPLTPRNPILYQNKKIFDNWNANFFIYFFMDWILKPVDIDGDNKFTIMDAYKYAGFKSNQKLEEIKIDHSKKIKNLLFKDEEIKQKPSPSDKLETEASDKKLEEELKILYLHQEPWILNANTARNTTFKI